MRANIERWLLIGLLALSYGSRVPGLIRMGTVGLPALVVGFFFYGCLIVLLVKSSAKAAFLIAVLAGIGGFVAPVVQLWVMPAISKAPPPSFLPVAVMAGISIMAALCGIDLWSIWRKRPNRPLDPAP